MRGMGVEESLSVYSEEHMSIAMPQSGLLLFSASRAQFGNLSPLGLQNTTARDDENGVKIWNLKCG